MHPPTVDPREDKAALRRHLLQRRAALPAQVRAAGDDARTALLLDMPLLTAAECVTVYLSARTEPNTSALLAAFTARGLRVLLPRLRDDGGLDLVADDGARVPGPRGTVAPAGPVSSATPDVWIVPALAVDREGVRLGRGGGAYDRVLPADVPVVALLHAGELVDRLPREPHDHPVTHAALPGAVVRLPA